MNLRIDGDELAWYLVGFIDGEGSFNVSFRKKSDYKLNWQPVLSFNVSQKDVSLLELLRQRFGCGIIKQRKRDNLFSYDVTKPSDLWTRVIPFFEKYPFMSENKAKNLEIFTQITKLMLEKKHLTKNGLKQIAELRETLNEGKGRTRKYRLDDVISESSETIRQPLS